MNDNYPKKLNNKELEEEVMKYIKSLKEHDINRGLLDDLLWKQAMITMGLMEQQNRSSFKALMISSLLGLFAIIISLFTT